MKYQEGNRQLAIGNRRNETGGMALWSAAAPTPLWISASAVADESTGRTAADLSSAPLPPEIQSGVGAPRFARGSAAALHSGRRAGFSRSILLVPLALLACAMLLAAQDAATGGAGVAPASAAASSTNPTSSRVRFDIDETGLPKQIYVAADVQELPLELRVPGAVVSDAALAAIGRGNRLRGPIRIEAVVEGKRVQAKTLKAGQEKDGTLQCQLIAGPYKINVAANYRYEVAAGRILAIDIGYEAQAGNSELEFMIEPVTPVDLAWDLHVAPLAGMRLSTTVPATVPTSVATTSPSTRFIPPAYYRDVALSTGEGVIWDDSRQNDFHDKMLFLGTGDGGITVGYDPSIREPNQSTVEVRRSKIGEVTFAVRLDRGNSDARKLKTRLLLIVSPTQSSAQCRRNLEWVSWPPSAKHSNTSRQGFEFMHDFCGDVGPGNYDHVDLYPSSLMRALAGSSASETLRVRSNVRQAACGDDPAYDRAILGRAMLHDIGVDANGLGQPAEYVRLVKALKGFGFFEANDIEFIPYWRSGTVVRFGEEFNPNSPFKLTEDNPAAGTYVSVYRRPFEKDGKKGYQAMFVIFNEQAKPVRERLYIFTPPRIWGGKGNVQTGSEIIAGYDFGRIPDGSDWRKKKVVDHHYVFGPPALMDLEDRSVANLSDSKGQTSEIYGPLHIQQHDYRVLWGYWLPGEEKKK